MSKNGGQQRNGGGKPGPKPKHTQRCPDCEDRDALNAVGLPRPHPWYSQPLKNPSRAIRGRLHLSLGCETCEGTGRVPVWYK